MLVPTQGNATGAALSWYAILAITSFNSPEPEKRKRDAAYVMPTLGATRWPGWADAARGWARSGSPSHGSHSEGDTADVCLGLTPK